MEKRVTKPAWLLALWSIVLVAIGLVLTVFIAVSIVGFQWGSLLTAFRVLWPAFLVIIGFVYVLVLLVARYPLATVSSVLLTVGFLFLLASLKRNDIGQPLNSAIYDAFDVNLLVGAFTISAFVLALFTIYKEREGKR